MNFYELTVPVLVRYLNKLNGVLNKAESAHEDMLQQRLQQDMLPFAQQINCAVGFALRACYPLMKLETPDISYADTSIQVLRNNLNSTLEILQSFSPEQFVISEQEQISLQAGQSSTIQLQPLAYVQQYALPNFFFHFSMAYGILRANDITLGKWDFDGFHAFPEGFHF